jgi:hypothetical protein
MNDPGEDYFEKTYDLIRDYSDNRLLLLKIQATKKTAQLTSRLIFIGISAMLLFLLFLFVSMMLGYYFAEITGSLFRGFGIVAGIYFVAFILFILLFRNYISIKIKDMVTSIFFENNSFDSDYDEE